MKKLVFHLNQKNAAAYLKITPKTLRKLNIPVFTPSPRCLRYSIKTLDAWQESQEAIQRIRKEALEDINK